MDPDLEISLSTGTEPWMNGSPFKRDARETSALPYETHPPELGALPCPIWTEPRGQPFRRSSTARERPWT